MTVIAEAKHRKLGDELLKHQTEIKAIADTLLVNLAARKATLDTLETKVSGDADFTSEHTNAVIAVKDFMNSEVQRVYEALTGTQV